MATSTSWNATPTDYQGKLLLAALVDSAHRIPSNAKGRTLDLMHARQWLLQFRSDDTHLDLGTRHTPGTHFRLTHHGVNAAKRFKDAQELHALAQQFAPQTIAVYRPEFDPNATAKKTAVVVVYSRPDRSGDRVKVNMYGIGEDPTMLLVPLRSLEPLPDLPPQAEGDPTDWWTVTDRAGNEVTRVEATNYPRARTAAQKVPAAAAVSRREGGLSYRRLRSSELELTLPELTATCRGA